ncbi:hypothetical protein J6590_027830 [Homalodisca vitripennis]|nr:hypothetical protein J6590_027830 [Homalodisca vitripennis]
MESEANQIWSTRRTRHGFNRRLPLPNSSSTLKVMSHYCSLIVEDGSRPVKHYRQSPATGDSGAAHPWRTSRPLLTSPDKADTTVSVRYGVAHPPIFWSDSITRGYTYNYYYWDWVGFYVFLH